MKNLRAFTSLLLIGFLLGGCSSKITLQKTTVQQWHGGVEGSGGGKNFVAYFQKQRSKAISFDKVWIGDREKGWTIECRIRANGMVSGSKTAEKGIRTFELLFSQNLPAYQGPNFPNTVVPLEKAPDDLPENFDKEIALYYHIGKEKGIIIIRDLEVLEAIYYP